MLKQMLSDDKADEVREAVVRSLGLLMGYVDDRDKYPQVTMATRGVTIVLHVTMVTMSARIKYPQVPKYSYHGIQELFLTGKHSMLTNHSNHVYNRSYNGSYKLSSLQQICLYDFVSIASSSTGTLVYPGCWAAVWWVACTQTSSRLLGLNINIVCIR